MALTGAKWWNGPTVAKSMHASPGMHRPLLRPRHSATNTHGTVDSASPTATDIDPQFGGQMRRHRDSRSPTAIENAELQLSKRKGSLSGQNVDYRTSRFGQGHAS